MNGIENCPNTLGKQGPIHACKNQLAEAIAENLKLTEELSARLNAVIKPSSPSPGMDAPDKIAVMQSDAAEWLKQRFHQVRIANDNIKSILSSLEL